MNSTIRFFALCQLALAILLLAGCSKLDTTYGKSDGTSGKRSLNGFDGMRSTLMRDFDDAEQKEDEGRFVDCEMRSRNVQRLSNRVNQHDAIIWLPTQWPPANLVDVTDYLDKWLRKGNRSVVFVIPDEGSTEAYWNAASNSAPPNQRLEYRRRRAQQVNDRLLNDAQRDDITLATWFTARALPARKFIDDRRVVSYDIHPFVAKQATKNSKTSKKKDNDTDDATQDFESDSPTNAPEKRPSKSSTPAISFDVLEATDGVTTLAKVTRRTWKNSQLIVVAGGGLLTNFAMTEKPALETAEQIRSELLSRAVVGEDERISFGFFNTDEMYVAISEVEPGAPTPTGLELLTTWPISLVTIHALFLGVVMCLMLLPTFGRARQVIYHRSTHFGNHLNAMAALMRRAGGLDYAREKINQYMRVIRGEPDLFIAKPQPVASTATDSTPAESKPAEPAAVTADNHSTEPTTTSISTNETSP